MQQQANDVFWNIVWNLAEQALLIGGIIMLFILGVGINKENAILKYTTEATVTRYEKGDSDYNRKIDIAFSDNEQQPRTMTITVRKTYAVGDTVRIWYSPNPMSEEDVSTGRGNGWYAISGAIILLIADVVWLIVLCTMYNTLPAKTIAGNAVLYVVFVLWIIMTTPINLPKEIR